MSESADPVPPPQRTSRCWTLHSVDGAVDVQVTARDTEALAAVLPALAAVVGPVGPVELWSGPTRLPGSLPLSAPELRHGAVLGLGRPGPRWADSGSSALQLHVTGGPDAGRTLPLGQGRHVLGRGGDAGIRFDDPDVSRRHAVIRVGNGEVTVTDLGSTNGTLLGDEALDGRPRPWRPGVALRLGATTATVAGPQPGRSVVEPSGGGRAVVRAAPRLTAPRTEVEVAFPRAPEAPSRRRLPWAAAAPATHGRQGSWPWSCTRRPSSSSPC